MITHKPKRFTRLMIDGEDAYSRLFAASDDPAIYARDKVRFELMRCLGRFVSESSEHSAEYTPYFLRDAGEIARFDVPVDDYIRRSERNLRRYAETRAKLLAGDSFPPMTAQDGLPDAMQSSFDPDLSNPEQGLADCRARRSEVRTSRRREGIADAGDHAA